MATCHYPKYNFCVWRGEDKELYLSFSQQDASANRVPVKLDDCRFEMLLGNHLSRQTIATLSSESGTLVTGRFEDGVFREGGEEATVLRVFIPRTVTTELRAAELCYELFKIEQDETRAMMIAGVIEVHGGLVHGKQN